MTTDRAAPPIRVGLCGLGRVGMNLIERFADTGPFRVVAAWDDRPLADLIAPFGVRFVSTPSELTNDSNVDVVWHTSRTVGQVSNLPASPRLVENLLQRKPLIVETPLTLSPVIADRVFQTAAESGRLLLIHHARRADPDFRQALAVAQDRSLGTIQAAKFVSWSHALPPLGAIRDSGPFLLDASDDLQITKLRLVTHALDQLASLVRDQPIRMFATGNPNASDFRTGDSLALRIVFAAGCQVEIDIRLDSPVPFQSGWMLTGERGGYAKGRRYTLTDEGEVFDSPVAPANSDEDADQFEWLARQIRSGVRDHAEEARIRTVVTLLDAAQRSLAAQQAVSV